LVHPLQRAHAVFELAPQDIVPNFHEPARPLDGKMVHREMGGFAMSIWSPKWFYALAACVAASLSAGAGTAEAAPLAGVGMRAPLVQNDVLSVGYRGSPAYDYGDYDDYYWGPGYYVRVPWVHGGAPPDYYPDYPPPYYGRRERKKEYVWVPPPRPRSCGQYHYWDGRCCVDARKYAPDLRPRW
jgi:hypothetical protein